MARRTARRRWSASVIVPASLAVLALLGASCSSSDAASSDGETSDAAGASTTVTTSAPERFDGEVDDFYAVPDPLPEGAPGQLIRVQPLGEADGTVTARIMYHSRDSLDDDRAVTGIVSYPTAPAPEGGWPVVSSAHGTTGLASQCAPSRAGAAAPGFGVEGVHVATDYIGLGPIGEVHSYLSGPSEGNSVIDAVRAARQLPESGAGTQWLAVGHSQGGHGALFAGERGAAYAPELDLLGTVSLAPAAELSETYGPVDEVVSRIVGVMALYGAAAERPEIDFDTYAGPQLEAVAPVFESGCVDEIISATAGIAGDTFYEVDPMTTEPAKSLMLDENNPGQVAVDSPLFLVSGTADERVAIDRVRALFDRLCESGQVTELLVVDGATHGSIIAMAAPEVTAWLNARIAGEPAPDSCP